jgi:hypothetical protein
MQGKFKKPHPQDNYGNDFPGRIDQNSDAKPGA